MKKIYIDPKLPEPTKKNLESYSFDESEIVFLYLHDLPSMQLKFTDFEKMIINNPKKKFILFSWLNFHNESHYKKIFEEHFTPTQIAMWNENVQYSQLPITIEEILKTI